MQIQDKALVEIDFRLTLDSGEEVDRSEDGQPLAFILGTNQLLPALEEKLRGIDVGQAADLVIDSSDAFGPRNPAFVKDIPRKDFPEGMKIEVGMIFQGQTPGGPANVRVLEIADDTVKGDFNHPLAGERLTFSVKVVTVREATEAELAARTSCETTTCGDGGCSSCG
jgi:FKBP-type peptidyl-prolyl cis-trans isomerase SlyD